MARKHAEPPPPEGPRPAARVQSAPRPGGCVIVNGVAVNAEGEPIPGLAVVDGAIVEIEPGTGTGTGTDDGTGTEAP